ncbi:MAG: nicotinate (nicotinamide) nucleotide adenylyltransferase [Bacteroidetes bacterium]|nr:MAG: nicotinate (nicotinamide) nucleotide adenylyltransferase [Bacteroidota bacterium]
MTLEKIGIFGGSFDPPHRGHVRVAIEAADRFKLDRVLWIPAAQSPFKSDQKSSSQSVRRELVESLMPLDDRFEVSDIELERGGVSYTVDTITTLRRDLPGVDFFLLLGEDSFAGFRDWKDPEIISSMVSLIVYPRRTHGIPIGHAKSSPGRFPANRMKIKAVDISSSEIREKVRRGLPFHHMVTESVAAIIDDRRLYVTPDAGISRPESLRDRVSQLVFPRIGSYLNPERSADADATDYIDLLDQYAFGGFVLFNGSTRTTPNSLRRLQNAARFPLLIAADMERGVGQQLKGASVFPHAMAFITLPAERSDSPIDSGSRRETIRRAASMQAREALNAGIHISFSPVADVHSNPTNPIISTRSFGNTPEIASAGVTAFINGCHSEGLLTTTKHFPGHGDTLADSHVAVPVVEKTRDQLEAVEFPPFHAAIQAGTDLIMTSHVQFPALDDGGNIATGSHKILTGLLRSEMGFKGVIISDSLLMDGAGGSVDGPRAAKLLESGVDILLDVPNPSQVVNELVDLVQSGELAESVVDSAVNRIWQLKTKLIEQHGTGVFSDPSATVPVTKAEQRSFARFADEIGRRVCGISGVCSERSVERSGLTDVCVVNVGPDKVFDDPTLTSLDDLFSERFKSVTVFDVPRSRADDEEFHIFAKTIHDHAAEANLMVVLVTAKPAAWQKFGISEKQNIFVHELLNIPGSVLAFSGLPLPEVDSDRANERVCLFSDTAPSIRGLVYMLAMRTTLSH